MLLEGERLVADALKAGWRPEFLLARSDREERSREWLAGLALDGAPPLHISDRSRHDKVSRLKTPPGILGVFAEPQRAGLAELESDLEGGLPALYLGVAGIADPGNLGALARCAEAVGAAGIIVVDGGARPYGPKALRGSMGSLLRLGVYSVGDVRSALAALDRCNVRSFRAATRGGSGLHDVSFPARTCLWMTSETGETPPELESVAGVTIPMAGQVESLNVTVAGALLLFEARRAMDRGAGS